jgi:hypothetical protein
VVATHAAGAPGFADRGCGEDNRYGFWELGRFAVAYRSLFGEAPSATLRRRREDSKLAEIIEPAWKFVKSA